MADANFTLKLVDRITAPARAMVKQLQSLTQAQKQVAKTAQEAQQSVNAIGASAAHAGAQAAAAATNVRKLASAAGALRSMRALTGSLAELRTLPGNVNHGPAFNPKLAGLGSSALHVQNSVGFGGRAIQGVVNSTRSLFSWNQAAGESIAKWQELAGAFMKTPIGFVVGGLGKIASGLWDIVSSIGMAVIKVGALGLGLGALAGTWLTKATVEMAGFAESSKKALGYLTGDKDLGAAAFDKAVGLAKQLGAATKDTVQQFIMLRQKQFSLGESDELIRLASDLKAVTGDAQAADRALVAISQIKAKGKLQAEELVGQLAEAGVPVELVYKNLEKTLGTNRDGLMKMLQKGMVGSDVGITAIKDAIKQSLGITEAGQLGKDFANNTLTGLTEQLKNAPENFALRIAKYLDIEPVKKSIRSLLAAIDSIDGNTVAGFVQAMVGGFAKMIPLVIEFGKGFGESFGEITKSVEAFFGTEDTIGEKAREAGKWLAEFFGKAIELVNQLKGPVFKGLEAFMKGLDLNNLIKQISSKNWEKFGQDLVVIANALGSVVNLTGSVLGALGFGSSPELKTINEQTEGVAQARELAAQSGFTGNPLGTLWDMLFGGDEASRRAPRPPGESRLGQGNRTISGTVINQTFNVPDADKLADEVRQSTADGLSEMMSIGQ